MTKLKLVILIIVCSLFGAMGGAIGGYYAAMTVSSVSSVAILDLDVLSRSLDFKDEKYKENAKQLSDRINSITAKLVASGMVVIDRSQVIAAPEESIIHVE